MTERKPDEVHITHELKQLGRHLTQTVKAVAGGEEVRKLGQELREGFKGMIEEMEETLDKAREREEVQRLRAQATRVADSVKSGEAQQEIREEVASAIHRLNEQLRALLQRIQPQDDEPPAQPTSSAGMPTERLDPNQPTVKNPYTNPDG
ncbi:MAG TPA: hypothetical protein VFZ66_14370 [Herpetosiphonaceae bacterium]